MQNLGNTNGICSTGDPTRKLLLAEAQTMLLQLLANLLLAR